MNRTLPRPALRRLLAAVCCALPLALPAADLHLAQGILAGEVTQTTAILQTRVTAVTGLTNGDVAGAPGTGQFEYATSETFQDVRRTPWLAATEKNDFILKAQIDGLRPATRYFYRVVYGPDTTHTQRSSAAQFKTLPAAGAAVPVNFILTSCLNYSFFHQGTKGQPGYQGSDRRLGYPALDAALRLQPDFCIIDGDAVYYDHPVETRAKTQVQLRRKWHEQYVQERFLKLFASVPTYWLKDDHDYRMNDSDPSGDYEPSHALGIATFREQAPVVNPATPQAPTYRTYRMGRDLQLWFPEGRDYRSPNSMPDGPEKTIWGAEQKAWLQRTLKESDATFKILVSPTPLIGPDDGSKKDNQVNPRGFRYEGEAFLAWLKDNGVAPGKFFIVCGDRHWKYHSKHTTGFEELSCGALNRENARLGRAPGDPKSTDPQSQVKQFYTDAAPSGGFLRIAVQPGSGRDSARIEFFHHDEFGATLYRHASQGR
jgi:alkaline phosphatase D